MQIGETVAKKGPPSGPIHAFLQVQEITFAGNHRVEDDTHGDFDTPEWVRGRRRQSPVCYTRDRKPKITAKFLVVIAPSASESVSIRGRVTLGATNLEWTASVQVAPADREVTTSEMTASAPLRNEVALHEPAMISWEAQPPGSSWQGAGGTDHLLYVVLADPAGTPAYWTLLDISCRGAAGATSEQALVTGAYSAFPSRRLSRRRDGQGLRYWNPDDTTATNTRQLLARTDGSGQCGSWAEFLIDMFKAHGVSSAEKVIIVRTLPELEKGAKKGGIGFLVKNWTFIGSGSLPAPFTHVKYTECKKENGIPGQRNANPPPGFYNHFIVKCFAKLYDPSYGGGPVDTTIEWESGAIDGLFLGGTAGYPKQKSPSTNLLEFWSYTTNARF